MLGMLKGEELLAGIKEKSKIGALKSKSSAAELEPYKDGSQHGLSAESLMEMGQSQEMVAVPLGRRIATKARSADDLQGTKKNASPMVMRTTSFYDMGSTASDELDLDREEATKQSGLFCFKKPSGNGTNAGSGGNYSFWKRNWCKIAATIALLALMAGLLLLFFLWPRDVTFSLIKVDKPADDRYMLSAIDGKVTVNVTSVIEAVVHNPNWFGINLKEAQVTGRWVMLEGPKAAFGHGALGEMANFSENEESEEETDLGEKLTKEKKKAVKISSRSNFHLALPYSIFFTADPTSDPIYRDFLTRCTDLQEDRRYIDMEFNVKCEASVIGSKQRREMSYSYHTPCPLSVQQIREVLKVAKAKVDYPGLKL